MKLRACDPVLDRAAVYAVCLQTGDAGQDATHQYRDPELLGHLYAGPYLALEPELATVLEDGAGVCGYVIGALDSVDFERRLELEWRPALRRRYPAPSGEPAGWSADQRAIRRLHDPPAPPAEALEGYPSHLHINLLPRAQGRGQGREMIDRLLGQLRGRGSPGVHLGVLARNRPAVGFYLALGFVELLRRGEGADEAIYMGSRLRPPR